MADWAVSVVRMRTTSGGGGNAVGIVTGMGASPEQALAALRQQGEQLAQQAGDQAAEVADRADKKAAERRARAAREAEDRRRAERERLAWGSGVRPTRVQVGSEHRARPPVTPARRDLRFEVIDVRLAPAPQDAQSTGWLAYGTLTFGFEGAPLQTTMAGGAETGTSPADGSRDDRSRDD